MMIQTVDDLIEELERCKKLYPEFGKYALCTNTNSDELDLRWVKLYINTDTGQVEIYPDLEN